MKLRYHIVLAILITSLIVSLIISLTPTPAICNPNEGCDTILSSSYAKTLGVNNSTIGIGIFALMSAITFSQIIRPGKNKKLLIHVGILLGALVSLYFIYIQAFVLHAWCKYCMVIDIGLILAFAIISVPQKKIKQEMINKNVL